MSSGVGLHNYEAEIVNKLSGMAIRNHPLDAFCRADNANSGGRLSLLAQRCGAIDKIHAD
jgi:hypothetical protein